MISSFDREIRARLAETLGCALGIVVEARCVRLPARHADASVHIPRGCDPASARDADFGFLFGAPLVSSVRLINGWLLFTFSDAFFDSLVGQINASLPLQESDGGRYAVNRMLALGRHSGEGCPSVPVFRRTLLEGISAAQSPAAFLRAARAAEALFHTIPPKERPALFERSGAYARALARLLANIR